MSETPLGKKIVYPKQYCPELLVAIPRVLSRNILKIKEDSLPFSGADIWNAYELSWLNARGKPQVAKGRFIFPCNAPNIIESKSLKLYLNSLNQESYSSLNEFRTVIINDLSKLAGITVAVEIELLQAQAELIEVPDGVCLDEQDLAITYQEPNVELLELDNASQQFSEIIDEVLYSNLFRSNCPITNQPDWASITICYQGRKISHAGLLKYLVSYRLHNDYHENCIEAIFIDIQQRCEPTALTVEANFLRRGGLDINPVRTTEKTLNYQNFPRFIRQ